MVDNYTNQTTISKEIFLIIEIKTKTFQIISNLS